MRTWAHQLNGPTLTKAWVGSYARVGPIAVVPGSPMVAPPAWHPDPSGRHQLRYWDGYRWSQHVSDDGVAGEDPIANP